MAYLPVLLLPGFCCFFPPFIPSLTQSCEKGWKTPLCLGEKGDFARQKYHNSLEPWMEMYIFSLSFIDVHISIHVYTYIYIQPFSYIYIYIYTFISMYVIWCIYLLVFLFKQMQIRMIPRLRYFTPFSMEIATRTLKITEALLFFSLKQNPNCYPPGN